MARVAIIGGGVTGLSAAYYLSKGGHKVFIFESDAELGGLAGSFTIENTRLEKFYHHWFKSDSYIMDIIKELGLDAKLDEVDSNTAVFVANKFFKLSSPRDLLKFRPLSFLARMRLGFATILLKYYRDWKKLEKLTAVQWLEKIYGKEVSQVIWIPLLKGKFGDHWNSISAVWMWNKLKLRGGSRKKGKETLFYLKGGFELLILKLAEQIKELGGVVKLQSPINNIEMIDSGKYELRHNNETIQFDHVICTIPLPLVSEVFSTVLSDTVRRSLERFKYLSNVCVILKTKKPLTNHYWVNVNDPSFPFVAIIEHTNFQSPDDYNGFNLVYLSKYCDQTDPLFKMSDDDVLKFTQDCIQRMFPGFSDENIVEHFVWRADYSQPIVERHYSRLLEKLNELPNGLHLASMAQIYPEDRGTNYAVREGLRVADDIMKFEIRKSG